ncbi:MAG: MBL fold metallo-hydrolase [Bryobacteraceae bacterium]
MTEQRFGTGAKPTGIVLTHGHFDHAGSARDLAEIWDVPIFAHALEMPYLAGGSAYPAKDPTVGGFMVFMSRFFPNGTDPLGPNLRELPADGELPGNGRLEVASHARSRAGTRLFIPCEPVHPTRRRCFYNCRSR